MHVWRDQGWFVNMFEIESNNNAGNNVKFATWKDKQGFEHPVGGWQGGRGWQINAAEINNATGNYLLAGMESSCFDFRTQPAPT